MPTASLQRGKSYSHKQVSWIWHKIIPGWYSSPGALVNTFSMALLPGQLWSRVVIPVRVLSVQSFTIIIIMSRRQRGYPWPSPAISPYHSSPPAGLQGYILCPHIVAVCRFVLVVPLLHIHMWGSTGVHRLWARPCFSSSVLRVWFVELV